VGTKIVTKRLKDGTIKRYRYYQLMRTYRQGKKGKTKYLRYLGKDPRLHLHRNSQPESGSRDVIANRDNPDDDSPPSDVIANCDRDPAPLNSLPLDVLANRDAARPPPLDLEVIEPESKGFWSFPRYRATCRRCGGKFEMIQFEVELGHYLCRRCRAEIINLAERLSWPGY